MTCIQGNAGSQSGLTFAELKDELSIEWTPAVVLARERDFRAHMPDSIQHQMLCFWLDERVPGWRQQAEGDDEVDFALACDWADRTQLEDMLTQLPEGSPRRAIVEDRLLCC